MFQKIFKLSENNTNVLNEFSASVSTFLALLYLLVINPSLIASCGVSFEFGFWATVLTLAFGTIVAGICTNKPYVLASYIAEVTFGVYFVVKIMKYSYFDALSCAFIAAIIFIFLSFFNLREKILRSIPEIFKQFFPVTIGFFLILVALFETGLFQTIDGKTVFQLTNLLNPKFILCFSCFILIPIFERMKIKQPICFSLLITFLIAYFTNNLQISGFNFSFNFVDTIGKINILKILKPEFFPAIFAFLVLLFIDTNSIVLTIQQTMKNEGIKIDENSKKKIMRIDAICSSVAPIFGSISCGVFPESAILIRSNAKTGLASVFLGFLFLGSVLIIPLIKTIPSYISSGVLIYIGAILIKTIKNQKVNVSDFASNFAVLMMVILTF